MRLIKRMGEQIEDEIGGVIEYAKDALEYKYSRPQLAEMYYKLANTEYGHVSTLHEAVVKLTEEANNKGLAVPQAMIDKWDEKHRCIIEKMAEGKLYLDMYRG